MIENKVRGMVSKTKGDEPSGINGDIQQLRESSTDNLLTFVKSNRGGEDESDMLLVRRARHCLRFWCDSHLVTEKLMTG
jgi:hypothetical protein